MSSPYRLDGMERSQVLAFLSPHPDQGASLQLAGRTHCRQNNSSRAEQGGRALDGNQKECRKRPRTCCTSPWPAPVSRSTCSSSQTLAGRTSPAGCGPWRWLLTAASRSCKTGVHEGEREGSEDQHEVGRVMARKGVKDWVWRVSTGWEGEFGVGKVAPGRQAKTIRRLAALEEVA
eukprot:365778-Chlamydomonas_euryale.AAC.7